MPTVRLRHASEYPAAAQKLFELSKLWFAYDFPEPPAMSRVMAWDPEFGGPHGCGKQLLHGPVLPLASNGERTQVRSDDHHDHRDQPGNEPAAGL